jgi:hypothetical protein
METVNDSAVNDSDTGAQGAEGNSAPEVNQELKNLKSEMGRKLSNYDATLQEVKRQNDELMRRLADKESPAPQAGKKMSDVLYEDADQFVDLIERRVSAVVDSTLSKKDERIQKQNAVMGALYQEFPEMTQPNSDLALKAVEIYNAMPAEDKTSPIAYKDAVKTAALELGIRPKSKREAQNDDPDAFSLNGSGGGNTRDVKKRTSGPQISAKTEIFAKLMGVDLTKEAKERMASGHGRTGYNKWS